MAGKRKYYNIIGISGSPRDKNTNYMLRTVLNAAGCEYELIVLKDKDIKPCNACGGCYKTHKCVVNDDMQELFKKLLKADIIVLGSPTYFDNVSAWLKIFMDRCLPFYFSRGLEGKKVGLVAVGNFRKGEVKFLDNWDPEQAKKNPIMKKMMQETVQKCINSMENFCKQLGLKIVGSVYAINSEPELEKDKLIELGRKLVS